MKTGWISIGLLFALCGTAFADEETPATDAPAGEKTEVSVSTGDATEGASHSEGSVTMNEGQFAVAVNVEANLSKEHVFKPFSIAPDLYYGVTNDLQLGLVHSTSALTGFRDGAGASLCLAGKDNGCPKVYHNIGVDAVYGFMRGDFAMGANVGLHLTNLDPMHMMAKVGVKGLYTAGALGIGFAPSIGIGLNKRDEGNTKQFIWVPVDVSYHVAEPFAIGIGTGIRGPSEKFGDNFTVPVGITAEYEVTPAVDVGLAFSLDRVTGGKAWRDAKLTGADERSLQIWGKYTM